MEEKYKKLSLEDVGMSKEQAAQLRRRLAAFAEDWDDPKMDAYNSL